MSKFLKCSLILLVAIFCMGARLPGSYEWDTLQDFLNRPQDNQSRESKKPASYLKKPWLAPDNLDEMERTNWPDYAMWDYDPGGNPDFSGGWPPINAPAERYDGFYPEHWYLCPHTGNPVDRNKNYRARFQAASTYFWILGDVVLKGPADLIEKSPDGATFHVLDEAKDWEQIRLTHFFMPRWWWDNKTWCRCDTDYYVLPEEEEEEQECVGTEPTIYSGVTEIARNANTTAWVNSGVSAVPPYSWTIAGTGFWFDAGYTLTTATTNADLETLTVYADNTACGTATITVTDACSVVSTGYIICTTGAWGDAVLVATQTKFDVCPSYPGCKSQYGGTYNDVCLWSEYSGIFRWNQSYYETSVGGCGCPGDDPVRSGACSLTVTDGMCTRTMDDPLSDGYCAIYLYRRAWICP